MGMTIDNLCDSCTNIECIFQSGIVRTECAFYMPPYIEPDNCGNYVVMQPTTEAIPKDQYDTRLKALDQEPQSFKWCTDCKEYDQEKHCCHRYSKVIRDTVVEIRQEQEPKTGHWIDSSNGWICSECNKDNAFDTNYCPYCGAKMEEDN